MRLTRALHQQIGHAGCEACWRTRAIVTATRFWSIEACAPPLTDSFPSGRPVPCTRLLLQPGGKRVCNITFETVSDDNRARRITI